MYLFKHFVGALATPLAIALLIGAFAAVCRTLGRRRIALWSSAVTLAVVYCRSMVLVGDALLAVLERKCPPLREDRIAVRTDGDA